MFYSIRVVFKVLNSKELRVTITINYHPYLLGLTYVIITYKVPITTAAWRKYCDILFLLVKSNVKGEGNPDDSSFIWKILINHEFWYQFHLHLLKSCGRLNICKWTVMEAAILYA